MFFFHIILPFLESYRTQRGCVAGVDDSRHYVRGEQPGKVLAHGVEARRHRSQQQLPQPRDQQRQQQHDRVVTRDAPRQAQQRARARDRRLDQRAPQPGATPHGAAATPPPGPQRARVEEPGHQRQHVPLLRVQVRQRAAAEHAQLAQQEHAHQRGQEHVSGGVVAARPVAAGAAALRRGRQRALPLVHLVVDERVNACDRAGAVRDVDVRGQRCICRRRLQRVLDRPDRAVPQLLLLLLVHVLAAVQREHVADQGQRALRPGLRALEVAVHVTRGIEDVVVAMASRVYKHQVHDRPHAEPDALREHVPPRRQNGVPAERVRHASAAAAGARGRRQVAYDAPPPHQRRPEPPLLHEHCVHHAVLVQRLLQRRAAAVRVQEVSRQHRRRAHK